MAIDSIPHRMRMQAKTRPTAPAYFRRISGAWVPTNWSTYAHEVETAARALIHLGVQKGQSPGILGFNAPSWTIAHLAGMMCGATPAGIYTTNSPAEVAYVAGHAESPILFIEDAKQWEKIASVRDQLPALKHVVLFDGHPPIDDPLVMTWSQFMACGETNLQAELLRRLDALTHDDVATLIYTSGTTGPPKAVMLTHGNLFATAQIAQKISNASPDDCVLSYLPLSHIAEQVFSIHGPVYLGYSVYFATSLEELLENLKEVQPTLLFGVPRIWEKFYEGISTKLDAATGVKKALAGWAQKVGRAAAPYRMNGEIPSGLLGVQYQLANKLVFSKLKEAIGLARARVCISGAAPIDGEVLAFFSSLDILVQEVYGQSEDCGPTTFNQLGKIRFGTVGTAVPTLELKIAEDGEVLARGPNVFVGYFKDPAATADTLTPDGWLRTGDLGVIDADGFLTITGRKKEIIITAGGKNIAPKNLEAALKRHAMINEAVVIGDRRKFLSALITLEPERAEEWARERNISLDTLHQDADLRALVQQHVDAINAEFAQVEQIKRFAILAKNFSVEGGELTPSLKVKRRIVYQQYADAIEDMYA